MKKISLLQNSIIVLCILCIVLLSGCNEQISEQGSAPIINFFNATPTIVILGNSSVLNWSVENATSVIIDNGIGNVNFSDLLTVTPEKNQTYNLTAVNSFGSSNASVKVDVIVINDNTSKENSAPIVYFFTATPMEVKLGESITLDWFVEGATSVSINNGIGEVGLSGPFTFRPTVSRKYILTATNEFGITYASIILKVDIWN